MKTNWYIELPQLLILAGMFVAAAWVWPTVPDSIPVHWNLYGEIDRYGSKFEGLLLLPLITAALYALLLFLHRIDPGRANYPSFQLSYTIIRLSLLLMMAVIYACAVLVSFGYQIKMATVIPLLIGLLLLVLGSVMGTIQPNWFVGVRTPWTLSSRLSWRKTHRLAGYLFVVMGLVIAGCGVVHTNAMVAIAGVIVVGSMVWMVVYSYLQWRDDPERLSPGQTVPFPDPNERG